MADGGPAVIPEDEDEDEIVEEFLRDVIADRPSVDDLRMLAATVEVAAGKADADALAEIPGVDPAALAAARNLVAAASIGSFLDDAGKPLGVLLAALAFAAAAVGDVEVQVAAAQAHRDAQEQIQATDQAAAQARRDPAQIEERGYREIEGQIRQFVREARERPKPSGSDRPD